MNMSCFHNVKIRIKSSDLPKYPLPIILSSHWLSSKHSHSCLPRDSTLVGQSRKAASDRLLRRLNETLYIVSYLMRLADYCTLETSNI